jgi:hypothetical protein
MQAGLKEVLREAAPQGKISCEAARALAERLNLPYALVGEATNELGIKINACQLGCFK